MYPHLPTFLCIVLLLCSNTILSQTTEISEILRSDDGYEIVIISQHPYYIGARDYHLYIEEVSYSNGFISNEEHSNVLKIFLSANEFNRLPEVGETRLSYGPSLPGQNKENSSKDIRRINLFNKKLLRN